ncbi:MAG: hypothetical protein FJY92_08820, partial [Candidatus Hydrogenedentes bacterium]|nr:hypothetical protein [Candidatus Hydrogenedentota bacterium]
MMEIEITSGVLVASALSCVALAIIVLVRSRRNAVHWAFIALCADLALWTAAIFFVVRAESVESARQYVHASFWIACFMPAAYYTFIGLFPSGRFDGSKVLLGVLATSGVALLGLSLAFGEQYVREIALVPGAAPKVRYGPILTGFSVLCALVFVSMHFNLYRKLRRSAGIERRQIQHVFLGVLFATATGALTNVVAPLMGVHDLEPYGPVFVTVMMGFFTYAMVRYHLLDILTILSRTAVFAISSGAVALMFIGSVAVVRWALRGLPV